MFLGLTWGCPPAAGLSAAGFSTVSDSFADGDSSNSVFELVGLAGGDIGSGDSRRGGGSSFAHGMWRSMFRSFLAGPMDMPSALRDAVSCWRRSKTDLMHV